MTTYGARGARKLLFLYGPPAVGKLTVGKSLAQQLSAILLHNHLTYDLAVSVLGPDSSFKTRRRFACQLRLRAMELLFEGDDRDVITTFCYSGSDDDWYVDALNALCRNHQVTLHFVRLTAASEHLIDRVGNADRRAFGKVNSRTQLAEILRDCNYRVSIQAINHICLDTSTVPPWRTALTLVNWINERPAIGTVES